MELHNFLHDSLNSKCADHSNCFRNTFDFIVLSLFQWCLAINNIDYVQQSIQAFVGELGMEEIVTSLANFRSETEADHCQRTLQRVIDNAVDTVDNKILELLEKVAEKVGN
jgi:hypothetical protein